MVGVDQSPHWPLATAPLYPAHIVHFCVRIKALLTTCKVKIRVHHVQVLVICSVLPTGPKRDYCVNVVSTSPTHKRLVNTT